MSVKRFRRTLVSKSAAFPFYGKNLSQTSAYSRDNEGRNGSPNEGKHQNRANVPEEMFLK